MSDYMQRYPVCCGRLSINKREGSLVCNSAGESLTPDTVSAHLLCCKAALATGVVPVLPDVLALP